MRTKKFERTDIVKVIQPGQLYTTYYEAFKELGFANPDDPKDLPHDSPMLNDEFIVIGTFVHETSGAIVYGIQHLKTCKQLAIEESGIKLIRKQTIMPIVLCTGKVISADSESLNIQYK